MKQFSIDELMEQVTRFKEPIDLEVSPLDRFEIRDTGLTTRMEFAGRPVGPLPMYQVKGLTGNPGINLTGTTRLIARVRNGDGEAMDVLQRQASNLNEALRGHNHVSKPLTMRIASDVDHDQPYIGGIVTKKYAPLTHIEVVELMTRTAGFAGATIQHMSITASRLDIALLLAGDTWRVDGGIKSGMRVFNGQFGDRSYGFAAMLFRLLCTNGMMDVIDQQRATGRHVNSITNLGADVLQVVERADEMFVSAERSMHVDVNVENALIQLYRRRFMNRGSLVKSLERRNETFGGTAVEGAQSTLWGLSQSITAAGRDYSFTQMSNLGRLAGNLVQRGLEPILAERRIQDDVPEDIVEEFGIKLAA